jgi:hypothetical protein
MPATLATITLDQLDRLIAARDAYRQIAKEALGDPAPQTVELPTGTYVIPQPQPLPLDDYLMKRLATMALELQDYNQDILSYDPYSGGACACSGKYYETDPECRCGMRSLLDYYRFEVARFLKLHPDFKYEVPKDMHRFIYLKPVDDEKRRVVVCKEIRKIFAFSLKEAWHIVQAGGFAPKLDSWVMPETCKRLDMANIPYETRVVEEF